MRILAEEVLTSPGISQYRLATVSEPFWINLQLRHVLSIEKDPPG